VPLDNADFGVAAERPSPSAVNKGKIFVSTDIPAVEISDGSAWIPFYSGGSQQGSGGDSGSSFYDLSSAFSTWDADGNVYEVVSGNSPAQVFVEINNPSSTHSMGVLLSFSSPSALLDAGAHVGAFTGYRSIQVGPSTVPGGVNSSFDIVSPPVGGGSSVTIPESIVNSYDVIPPGGSAVYSATDVLSVSGDGLSHGIQFTGFAVLTAIGSVISVDHEAITLITSLAYGDDTFRMYGTGLNAATRFRISDGISLDEYLYDSSGPNAGLNPPGYTVTVVSSTIVEVNAAALDGLTINEIEARNALDAIVDTIYPSVFIP